MALAVVHVLNTYVGSFCGSHAPEICGPVFQKCYPIRQDVCIHIFVGKLKFYFKIFRSHMKMMSVDRLIDLLYCFDIQKFHLIYFIHSLIRFSMHQGVGPYLVHFVKKITMQLKLALKVRSSCFYHYAQFEPGIICYVVSEGNSRRNI